MDGGLIMRKEIDINSWKRNWQYNVFYPRSYPYLSVASPVNVDYLVRLAKETHLSFYALMSFVTMKTIQEIEEFKYVLDNEKIYKYEVINMSFTVLNAEQQVRFSPTVKFDEDLFVFLERFLTAKKMGEEEIPLSEYSENNLVYITCLPWMRITSMLNPMDEENKDSVPRICWGKYFETDEGYNIDVSIQVNHAFQDGYHLGLFYEGLERNINDLKSMDIIEKIPEFLENISQITDNKIKSVEKVLK